MFQDEKPKVRRFTPSEQETENQLAQAFKRPPRYFTGTPLYTLGLVPEPIANQLPIVNFRLNYKE